MTSYKEKKKAYEREQQRLGEEFPGRKIGWTSKRLEEIAPGLATMVDMADEGEAQPPIRFRVVSRMEGDDISESYQGDHLKRRPKFTETSLVEFLALLVGEGRFEIVPPLNLTKKGGGSAPDHNQAHPDCWTIYFHDDYD